MIIKTRDFGYVEVSGEDIIAFHEGIPGFDHLHRYVLLVHKDVDNSLIWMQSVDDPDICFIVFSPAEILPGYNPIIPEEALKDLKLTSQDAFRILLIATIPEDFKKMTLNLKSPILINAAKGIAKQIILDASEYPLRYRYFEETAQRSDGQCS